MMKKRTEKGMLFKLQQKVALYEAVTKEIARVRKVSYKAQT